MVVGACWNILLNSMLCDKAYSREKWLGIVSFVSWELVLIVHGCWKFVLGNCCFAAKMVVG